LGMFI